MADNPQFPAQPPAPEYPENTHVVPPSPDQPPAQEDSKKPSEIKESSPKEEKFLSIEELSELIKDGDWVTLEVGGVVVGRAQVLKKA